MSDTAIDIAAKISVKEFPSIETPLVLSITESVIKELVSMGWVSKAELQSRLLEAHNNACKEEVRNCRDSFFEGVESERERSERDRY